MEYNPTQKGEKRILMQLKFKAFSKKKKRMIKTFWNERNSKHLDVRL
jgi:hypothetical protein